MHRGLILLVLKGPIAVFVGCIGHISREVPVNLQYRVSERGHAYYFMQKHECHITLLHTDFFNVKPSFVQILTIWE